MVSPSLLYKGNFDDPLPEGFGAIMQLLEDHSDKVVVVVTKLNLPIY